jgi:hypothetical protein
MGSRVVWVMTTGLILSAGGGHQEVQDDDRLYGRVVTAAGDVFEGYLRWDKNEGSWADVLDGTKDTPWESFRDAERLDRESSRRARENSINILGLRISWSGDEEVVPASSTSGIRFGHIHSLAVMGDDRALLTLKSGEEVELHGGATDLGDELRSLVVEDAQRGWVELRWADLDLVEFMAAPTGSSPPEGRRLRGTLRTRGGMEFTGLVSWDRDEILSTDVLDGEERGVEVEFPFSSIVAIERAGSSGARVVLSDGEEVMLRGSNDVDHGNRGIAISDPGLGQVEVRWDAFDEIAFHESLVESGGYDGFDGGHSLRGTVETEDGTLLTGWIRWDNDEASGWELLNGEDRGVTFEIEFAQIASIRRLGSWGCEVTLRDGRIFELEGSNDVDSGNKGIYINLDDEETVLVPWWDFREAVLIWG